MVYKVQMSPNLLQVKGQALPCASWTSCCPPRQNDGGASCVSSQNADSLSPHRPHQSQGHTWSFWSKVKDQIRQKKVHLLTLRRETTVFSGYSCFGFA